MAFDMSTRTSEYLAAMTAKLGPELVELESISPDIPSDYLMAMLIAWKEGWVELTDIDALLVSVCVF